MSEWAFFDDLPVTYPTDSSGGRAMTGFVKNATDKNLRAWLNAGPVDRGVGDGLTFVASEAGSQQGKASWILRYRFGGREREKVLGRYIKGKYKHPEVVERVIRLHIKPVIGKLPVEEVRPVHIDRVLTKIVAVQLRFPLKTLGHYWSFLVP
jgi:hypothetical protein